MEDSIHHKQLRQNLMNIIHAKGINDIRVLEAMNKVPRHLFLDPFHTPAEAYEDKPIEIGEGQTISQPYTVAYQSSLLNVKHSDKILEVGTGSGYQSAILYELGAELYTIERQEKLFTTAKARLNELGYGQIHQFFGDGHEGLPEQAPFDKILVTAAAPEIPSKLVEQLKTDGIMVIPVNGNLQKMLRLRKNPAGGIDIEEFDHFTFVPLLRGTVGR